MLTLQDVSASVGSKTIINRFSYTFKNNTSYIIMGPNGSGKSTLAHVIMGNPHYLVNPQSHIFFNKKDITHETPDKRAAKGLFLSFQNPLAIPGVTVFQMLRVALKGKKDVLTVQEDIQKTAKKLSIPTDLLQRPLNVGASGGEKKKLEVLQAGVIDPHLIIFDEIDTGVDIDSLKTISSYLNTLRKNKTLIFITHNSKLSKHIPADEVLVVKNGTLVQSGDSQLIRKIETDGFEKF